MALSAAAFALGSSGIKYEHFKQAAEAEDKRKKIEQFIKMPLLHKLMPENKAENDCLPFWLIMMLMIAPCLFFYIFMPHKWGWVLPFLFMWVNSIQLSKKVLRYLKLY